MQICDFRIFLQYRNFDGRDFDHGKWIVDLMDAHAILARLKAMGWSQRAIAARLSHLGFDQVKISKTAAGTRHVRVEELDALRELLAEVDSEAGVALGSLPIIGQVSAGAWRQAVQRPIASMPRPDPSVPARAFALRVAGDSMDLLVEDGGTVIVDPEDRDLFPGRYYVIINSDGETTFKQFKSDPARLVACSSNLAYKDIPIGSAFEIVGRVIWRASRM